MPNKLVAPEEMAVYFMDVVEKAEEECGLEKDELLNAILND